MPGLIFGFVKQLGSSGSHCTKWAYEQHRPAGFESRLVPDLPLLFIPILIGLQAFDLVSSLVWWGTLANIGILSNPLLGVTGFHTSLKGICPKANVILFINPSALVGYDTRSIFKRSLTGLNLEFSFSLTSCLTKAEEHSLPNYLPIAGGRIIGFIPFPRVLVQYEMQSISSRIWTRVAVSISYDDNHYTTGTESERNRARSQTLSIYSFNWCHFLYQESVNIPTTLCSVCVCERERERGREFLKISAV